MVWNVIGFLGQAFVTNLTVVWNMVGFWTKFDWLAVEFVACWIMIECLVLALAADWFH